MTRRSATTKTTKRQDCWNSCATPTRRDLTHADLAPNYRILDQLYLRLFIAARHFCAGEHTHVFK